LKSKRGSLPRSWGWGKIWSSNRSRTKQNKKDWSICLSKVRFSLISYCKITKKQDLSRLMLLISLSLRLIRYQRLGMLTGNHQCQKDTKKSKQRWLMMTESRLVI